MNLYKIGFMHYSQKDNEDGMKEYTIAKNDGEIFDYINKNYAYEAWTDREDLDNQSYKDFVLEHKGDDEDENLFENLYYGQTTYSWELIKKDISNEDISKLVELNILKLALDK